MRTRPLNSQSPEAALLPMDPPARAARWIAWLLLGISAAAVIFAATVKLPEVVSAPFVLEPEEGTDPIQAPLAAELAAIEVRDGQEVKAGERLFDLRSDEIRGWQARLRQVQEDQRALGKRRRNLEEAHAAQLAIKDAEIVQAEREVGFRQKYLETSKDFLRRAEVLAAEGLIAQVELIRHQLEAAQAEKDLVLGEKGKQQIILQRQELVTTRARQQTDEEADVEKLKVQAALLERQLEDCTNDIKSVRAPYHAVVLSLKQRHAGSMVGIGTELCQLARAEARPRARLTLPEASVPRLKPGQTLRLRYEAYPYQRFGSVPALLEWISPAAINGPNGAIFQAICTLPRRPNGSSIQPKVGMKGQARILLARRTLLEKFLEPFRMLRERLDG